MANKNCLLGMKCPDCGSLEPFRIEITSVAVMTDDGTDYTENHEWNEKSYCECDVCHSHGIVKHFQIEYQEVKKVRKTCLKDLPLLVGELTTDEGIKALEKKLKGGRK